MPVCNHSTKEAEEDQKEVQGYSLLYHQSVSKKVSSQVILLSAWSGTKQSLLHNSPSAIPGQSSFHARSSQPHRRVPVVVVSVPCYPQLLSLLLQYGAGRLLRVEPFYVCTVRDRHMNECQKRCWCDWGTELLFLSILPCVTGGKHTEPLSQAFTSLLPVDYSSLKCIHAHQHPSATWCLLSNQQGFQADFFSTWTFCSPGLLVSLDYKWFTLVITWSRILPETLFCKLV